jgi:hypothetical protein
MAAKHLTMRGEPIDMGALVTRNAEKVAIGNASMNARGDILGPNGIVLRTQEQIEEEWNRQKAAQDAVTAMDIKAPMPGPSPVPQMTPNIQKKVMADDQDFDPSNATPAMPKMATEMPTPPRRRKIVESD